MELNYPLNMSFKLLALAPQIYVRDADGNTVCYVKQKLLKLKEAVTVFSDDSQQKVLCEIKADRVIDFSANYPFYDAQGEVFGRMARKGMRSLWKAHYEVFDAEDSPVSVISEENPMAKVADSLMGEVPGLSLLSGYLFHPKYSLKTADTEEIKMRLTKEPSMFEAKFRIDRLYDYDNQAELRGIMAFLMMTLLERAKG